MLAQLWTQILTRTTHLVNQSLKQVPFLGEMLPLTPAMVVLTVLVTAGFSALKPWGEPEPGEIPWEGLQALELRVWDQMVRIRPDQGTDPRLLVVGIAESDLTATWPLPDATVAEALKTLQKYRPKAIGLDLYRNLAHPPGSAALQQQLQATNLVTIYELGDAVSGRVPPVPGVSSEQMGFNDLLLDPDGVIRRSFLYGYDDGQDYYSFALRLVLQALKESEAANLPTIIPTPKALQIGQTTVPRLNHNSGGYENIDNTAYQILINYQSSAIARRVTLAQVLDGKVNPEWVEGKIVLIGSTAPSLKDLFLTPYSPGIVTHRPQTPAVLIHAQQVSQLLNILTNGSGLFHFWPQWAEILWLGGWVFVGGAIARWLEHPVALGGALSGAAIGLMGGSFLLFNALVWVPVVSPFLGLLLSAGAMLGYRLFYSTFYDDLTGLPNRALLLERMNRFLKRCNTQPDSSLTLLVLDLDRLGLINESFGYQGGDQLLKAMVKRLRKAPMGARAIARVGGDEFAILLPDTTLEQATQFSEDLQERLTHPYQIQDQSALSSASIGIVVHQSGQTSKPEDLLRDGHTALFRAKALGKSRYTVFTSGMHTQALQRVKLEVDLHRALEEKEFVLNYQPIVELQTGAIVGFEALLRWRSSQHGWVMPGQFIPVAEETGLIVPIGDWVLEEACRQRQTWKRQFPNHRNLFISVNLASQQLQGNLVEYIARLLRQYGVAGHQIKVEITESNTIQNIDSTIDLLLRLKALKVHICLDDFGTGYASLSYLCRLPVDTLKIDRSFVMHTDTSEQDVVVVRSVILLARGIGLDVVAEGIENVQQLYQLRSLQCQYGQGFFFSKPIDAQQATELLTSPPDWKNHRHQDNRKG